MRMILLCATAAAALALAGCSKPADTTAADTTTMNDTAITPPAETLNATGNSADTNAMTAGGVEGSGLTNGSATTAMTGQQFADAAAQSDAFEKAEGMLAEKMGKDKAVKSYGTMMVAAHTKTTTDLKAAAAKASPAITPDPTLPADKQAKVDALKALSGDAFDKQYASDQVAAHQEALDAMKAYAASGDVPSLKEAATKTAPLVQSHLDMAKKLPM